MKPQRFLLVLALILLAGCSASGGKGANTPSVATVNGVPIPLARFTEKYKVVSMGFGNSSGAAAQAKEARMEVLSELIEDEMYLQEAARLNVSATPGELADRLKKAMADYPNGAFEKELKANGLTLDEYKEELGRKLTVEKLIDREVYKKVGIDRGRLVKYYEGHKSSFKRPLRVRARQILVDNPTDAKAILEKLKKGGNFESIAMDKSLSPDSAMGGDLGYFSKGDMPAEFDVVFRMKPGQVSPVVKSQYGYHIFKLESTQKAGTPRFEEVEGEVRKRVYSETGEVAFKTWHDGLKGRTKIDVNFDALGGQ